MKVNKEQQIKGLKSVLKTVPINVFKRGLNRLKKAGFIRRAEKERIERLVRKEILKISWINWQRL